MESEVRACGSYDSNQRILVVGDGDFSFCFSLCKQLRSGKNLIATSYDSYEALVKKYVDAAANTQQITSLGSIVLHSVDATNLQETLKLPAHCTTSGPNDTDRSFATQNDEKFDRIIFQFPLVYAMPDKKSFEADPDPCIRNRRLIREFFHSAYHLLRDERSQIHISSKETRPYLEWNIETLAKGILNDEEIGGDIAKEESEKELSVATAMRGDNFGFLCKYPFEREAFPEYKSRNVMHTDGFPLTDAYTFVYGFGSTQLPLESLEFIYDTKYFHFKCLFCKKKFTNELDNEKHHASQDHKRAARLGAIWEKERARIDLKWRERRKPESLRSNTNESTTTSANELSSGNFFNEPAIISCDAIGTGETAKRKRHDDPETTDTPNKRFD